MKKSILFSAALLIGLAAGTEAMASACQAGIDDIMRQRMPRQMKLQMLQAAGAHCPKEAKAALAALEAARAAKQKERNADALYAAWQALKKQDRTKKVADADIAKAYLKGRTGADKFAWARQLVTKDKVWKLEGENYQYYVNFVSSKEKRAHVLLKLTKAGIANKYQVPGDAQAWVDFEKPAHIPKRGHFFVPAKGAYRMLSSKVLIPHRAKIECEVVYNVKFSDVIGKSDVRRIWRHYAQKKGIEVGAVGGGSPFPSDFSPGKMIADAKFEPGDGKVRTFDTEIEVNLTKFLKKTYLELVKYSDGLPEQLKAKLNKPITLTDGHLWCYTSSR